MHVVQVMSPAWFKMLRFHSSTESGEDKNSPGKYGRNLEHIHSLPFVFH
jgi:hypothetical protein